MPPHECPSRTKLLRSRCNRLPDLLDLVDEPRDLPQLRRIGLVAVRRTELVIIVYSTPAAGR